MAIQINSEDDEPVSAINTTPLVDVMLVLLIIFLITIPVVVQSVKVDLPKETNKPVHSRLGAVDLTIDASGRIYWNATITTSREALLVRLRETARMERQPEINIRSDREADFEHVARLVADLQRTGIKNLSFIVEPEGRNGR